MNDRDQRAGSAGGLADRVLALQSVADRLGVSVQHVALAWVASHGTHVVPVLGARSASNIQDSARATELRLWAEDIALLSARPCDNDQVERQ
ncbi:aldo/keto reductase [Streptomyces sp. NPDC001185]|uniref:aldo/keto reductase n=1 Tax=Streptomyces sp. NPDC001185 TaxID=3154380 RepID=UPI0033224F82